MDQLHDHHPSALSLQSALLLIEWPRHLKVSSLRLSSELPSAVLAFLSLSLVSLAISSKSVLLLILWMLSLGYRLLAESLLHLPHSAHDWIHLPMLVMPAYPLHHSPIHCLSICSDFFSSLYVPLLPNQSVIVLLCPVGCRYCQIVVRCVQNCMKSLLLVHPAQLVY